MTPGQKAWATRQARERYRLRPVHYHSDHLDDLIEGDECDDCRPQPDAVAESAWLAEHPNFVLDSSARVRVQ
jgi:hypothetical protein